MRAHASFRPCAALISPVHVKFSENVTLDLSDAPVYRAVLFYIHLLAKLKRIRGCARCLSDSSSAARNVILYDVAGCVDSLR